MYLHVNDVVARIANVTYVITAIHEEDGSVDVRTNDADGFEYRGVPVDILYRIDKPIFEPPSKPEVVGLGTPLWLKRLYDEDNDDDGDWSDGWSDDWLDDWGSWDIDMQDTQEELEK